MTLLDRNQQLVSASDLFIGEWYHLYNRGANKSTIFHQESDWHRFQTLLFLANSKTPIHFQKTRDKLLSEIARGETLVDIASYVLMHNHFHILAKERLLGGREMFLRKLCTAYTMYYNKKYNHSGVIFQGDSKSKRIADDEYFQYLSLYIHLNPVKNIEPEWKTKTDLDYKKVKKFLENYTHSSYIDFTGKNRDERSILSPLDGDIKNYFEIEPEKMLERWLTIRDESL